MQKPTIFFSHSSLDKEYISPLREMILRKTAKTIEIFQCSDGQSIPFGNNWVHKIEENLEHAKIMFVFVSPKSINSQWIYFEAGYAYSKRIKVIPIGINGVNIGELKAPLSLLQGFNITSEAEIGNIVSILNKEFGCEYNEEFIESDYSQLTTTTDIFEIEKNSTLENIDFFLFRFKHKIEYTDGTIIYIKSPIDKNITSILDTINLEYSISEYNKKISTYGMTFSYSHRERVNDGLIDLRIEGYKFLNSPEIIKEIIKSLYEDDNKKKHTINVYFNKDIELLVEDFKISSLLQKTGISICTSGEDYFQYNEILFKIFIPSSISNSNLNKPHLQCVIDTESFTSNSIIELIAALFMAKVIYKKA